MKHTIHCSDYLLGCSFYVRVKYRSSLGTRSAPCLEHITGKGKMLKRFLAYSKVAIPLLLGICIGIALSFIILPFIEERTCEWDSSYAFTLKRHTKAVKNNGDRFFDGIDLNSFRGAEFDPLVIESKQSGAHSVKKPVRQRFAHSEIDMKEPIFVGYLSSPDQLKNRLVALNKTLVNYATPNTLAVKFFINASKKQVDQSTTSTASSIVALNLLDVNLLPLISLKHMANQYGRRYKYFMLTPDTVYTKKSLTDGISSLKDEEPCFCFASDDETDCDYSTGLLISNVSMRACFVSNSDSLDYFYMQMILPLYNGLQSKHEFREMFKRYIHKNFAIVCIPHFLGKYSNTSVNTGSEQ